MKTSNINEREHVFFRNTTHERTNVFLGIRVVGKFSSKYRGVEKSEVGKVLFKLEIIERSWKVSNWFIGISLKTP